MRVTGTANTARWIETNFSSRSKRAIVNQYSGAPVHACPDFAMSRGNYLWEQCGTVQLLSRASELSNVHPRDTRIFNLAVTVTATTNSTGWFAVFVKKWRFSRLRKLVDRTRVPAFDLFKIILAAFQAYATPGIAKESANIRRRIFITNDNGGESRLAASKAWFIARIRDLNCHATCEQTVHEIDDSE